MRRTSSIDFFEREGGIVGVGFGVSTMCHGLRKYVHDACQGAGKYGITVQNKQYASSRDTPTPYASHFFSQCDGMLVAAKHCGQCGESFERSSYDM